MPLPIPIPAVPPRTARAPTSSLPPARKNRRRSRAARAPPTRRKTRPSSPRFRTVPPVTNVVALVPDVVAPPVTNVVASVANLGVPASDVIALIEDMLTSGASAVVPLTQLHSDLASLFGIAGVQPVVVGSGGIDGPGLSAAAGASVASSQLPLGLPIAGIPGVPLAGNPATAVATLDVIARGRASSLSSARSRCRRRPGWHR